MRPLTAVLRAPEMLRCLRAMVEDHRPADCAGAGQPCWPHRIIERIDRADGIPPASDPDGGRRGD